MDKRQPFLPLSNLLGTAIVDVNGAVIGHVSEFLVDEVDGRIAYVQIRLTRNRSASIRRVTVPFSTIRSGRGTGRTMHLRVAESTLRTLAARKSSGIKAL